MGPAWGLFPEGPLLSLRSSDRFQRFKGWNGRGVVSALFKGWNGQGVVSALFVRAGMARGAFQTCFYA